MGIILSPKPEGEDEDEVEEEPGFRKPKFYRGREGPKYRIINFTRDYEYREYEASTWIAVRISGLPYGKAVKKAHSALSKYLDGKNGPEREMKETCPLRTQVYWEQNLEEPGEFTVSLHLPWENQGNPPSPTDSELIIQDQPKHFAYVRVFDGIADEYTWKEQAQILSGVLDKKGTEYSDELYYTSRFEHPLRIGKKHNEIIFPVC